MSDDGETILEGGDTASQSGPDLAGAALGALSASDEAEVRAAAAADERIAQELAALQEVTAEMASAISLRQISRGRSAGIRSRLISRAMASREGQSAGRAAKVARGSSPDAARATPAGSPIRHSHSEQGGGPPYPQTSPNLRPVAAHRNPQFNWLALAGGLAFLLTGVGFIRVVRDRDRLRAAVTAQTDLVKKVAELKASVTSKDSMITSLTGPNMKVLDLVNYASQAPLARMFWNQQTQEWTLYAYNLRQPKAGKVFQVWLITNTKAQPVSAGTFTPDARGSAVLRARYPLDRNALTKVAVSEEPAGGVSYPTGPIIVAATGT